MKRCLAVLLSVWLLMTSVLPVSASGNYNDDQFDWGEYACTHGTTKSVDAVASTCLTPGHDAYTRCVECGVLLSGSDAELPLGDHAYDNACDADCNVCGETRETAHDYRDTVTAPNCENSGYTVHTCTVCGDTYVDNRVDALGHSYGLTEHVPPTCAADGKKVYVCATCGDSYTEPLPATGQHTYEHSCDETCDVCGYVRDDAHDYIAHYFVEPTCGEEGCEVYKCWGLFCENPYRYITIPATGNHTYSGLCDGKCDVCGQHREDIAQHDYRLTAAVVATCTTDGKNTYTCVGCGDSYSDIIVAKGHKYDIVITKPDCENGGYTTHTCSVCGDIQVDNRVDALGHTPGAPSDCVNEQTCTVCGAVLKEALGHDWTDATCTAPKTCSTCGATEGEALDHIPGAPADCENPQTCTVCDAVLKEALGHRWTDATCTAPKTCTTCGATEGEALGHTPGAPADCENPQTCTVCGAVLKEALGHDWTDATCTAPKTCSTCGATEGDALGHTSGAPADCVNAQTCTVCGAVLKEVLGHDWTDATCTAPKTCTTCGATEGDALGHSYDDDRDTDCNTCGAVREPLSIPGDLNRDGDVNNRDLVAVQQYLNNWEITVDEVAADVTGDGEINNRDLVLLQQYLNGWDVTLK